MTMKNRNAYIGHPLQLRGAEPYILQGGRGDGMHLLCVRNGLGLEAWISLDRCADLSRVSFGGDNMGYFSPCGYVAPAYYDAVGSGFLKSFTAGFFTTCGLTAVGSPCTDAGEQLPLHGSIANTPAQLLGMEESEAGLTVRAQVRDCTIFGRKLILDRQYTFSYTENTIAVRDTVHNAGDSESPYMLLYHCNMGYPLLQEDTQVVIPHTGMTPRNSHAAAHAATALTMEPPQAGYEECCYYYDVAAKDGQAAVGAYSPSIDKGVVIAYNSLELPRFVEWKMMGKTDYVLGLEPGNCTPDGRDVLRREGTLPFLTAGESAATGVTFRFIHGKTAFEGAF